MESAPEGYRKNVAICLINPSKKILGAKRIDSPDLGKCRRDTAIRELREETGVTSAEIIAEVPCWLTYDFPADKRERLNALWGTNVKGQAQKWFLLRFNGKDEEVNLLGDGTERPEFSEWSWMTPQQLLDLVVSMKKPVYEEVLRTFAPHFQSDSS